MSDNERRERYAAAISATCDYFEDLDPDVAADAVMAVADREQSELRAELDAAVKVAHQSRDRVSELLLELRTLRKR